MRKRNLLLVDDDKNFLRVLTYQVEDFGYRGVPISTPGEALKLLKEKKFDLVVTDLKMPGMDGLQLLAEIRKAHADLPVIVLTAHGTVDKAVQAIKEGAFDFLTKPFEQDEIEHVIANALRMATLVQENRRLAQAVQKKFQIAGIIGSAKKFREVLDLAEQLAAVATTVLIQGESGTGKEVIARAIHYASDRCKRPFVVVNCGAIPKDLIESELFGYRKGAFTGAVANRKGKFEAADSGTLFLDEVAELPANMQVKLLRVLQEREIDVVGDPHPHPVDVRILAATNQDLQRRMEDGHFREDLYYRLSVAPLHLPPLRERREDIPLLVNHFLKECREKFEKDVSFETAAMEALQLYHWPGNVRELENVVERLVVFDRRGTIRARELPAQFRSPRTVEGKVVMQLPDEGFSLQELERDVLLGALQKHGWNQSQAARYLGITRNTLVYRIEKYGLKRDK